MQKLGAVNDFQMYTKLEKMLSLIPRSTIPSADLSLLSCRLNQGFDIFADGIYLYPWSWSAGLFVLEIDNYRPFLGPLKNRCVAKNMAFKRKKKKHIFKENLMPKKVKAPIKKRD